MTAVSVASREHSQSFDEPRQARSSSLKQARPYAPRNVLASIAIVPMGSFDDDPGVRPERHILVGSKATWDEIHDDLPQFDGQATS